MSNQNDIRVLNLYAGIGGNRKLWENVRVVAVENNPKIAKIYQDFFPNDKVIIYDAHKFLLENFEKFDFIWSSPPCPTHSKIRIYSAVARGQNKPIYPDMNLYQEILLLKYYFKGKWCVENVVGFYDPLVRPSEFGNHYFWHNFHIRPIKIQDREHNSKVDALEQRKGFDLRKYKDIGVEKKLILRNCVEPELGLHILNESKRDIQGDLFRNGPNST